VTTRTDFSVRGVVRVFQMRKSDTTDDAEDTLDDASDFLVGGSDGRLYACQSPVLKRTPIRRQQTDRRQLVP